MPKLSFVLALFFCVSSHAQDFTAIRTARLIDDTVAAPITNALVIVTGNKITAAGSNLAVTVTDTIPAVLACFSTVAGRADYGCRSDALAPG